MGIDYQKFHDKSIEIQSKPIEKRSKQHQDIDRFLMGAPNRKLILSIDRLDYTKGIPARIKAYRQFLIDYPEYKEQVSLIMLTVPSRVDVEQYLNLKSEIEELVGNINGEFGSVNWNPIIYFYRSLPFENLIELYTSSHIALLTPLRDGMNLVAKEFLATKTNQKGVLILSEMAGAAKELGEAIIVNPNNFKDVSDAIFKAIVMDLSDQAKNLSSMQGRIKKYDVYKWASEFIKALDNTSEKHAQNQARRVSESIMTKMKLCFSEADKKILFLDYDGTLQRFFNSPGEAKPDKELYDLLHKLSIQPNTDLVLISGRDKNTLNEWFGDKNFALIAEHGAWVKEKGENWLERIHGNSTWKESIRPIIDSYIDRTPGSLIEEKSHSLVWHYRKADIELGLLRALELKTDLSNLILNQDLEILEGSKVIEIKEAGINKGAAANNYTHQKKYDFILAMGDDWTDEYLFKALPKETFTIKVGTDRSEATYFVDNYNEVRNLLGDLITI
jgi:trehalose 6-phosphate synthase/phosphatase